MLNVEVPRDVGEACAKSTRWPWVLLVAHGLASDHSTGSEATFLEA